jgi:hypothetical protein
MLYEGEETFARPEVKEGKDLAVRPFLPASASMTVSAGEREVEKENRQTARIFVGLMAASFFAGMLTKIFGFKKRS